MGKALRPVPKPWSVPYYFFELRIDFGPGYRVYFGTDGEIMIILLGGGSKSGQQQDIERA